jgi:hypothetical protein
MADRIASVNQALVTMILQPYKLPNPSTLF